MPAEPSPSLAFNNGTLEIRHLADASVLPSACIWDERTHCHRAPAMAYAEVVMAFVRANVDYRDTARSYETLSEGLRIERLPTAAPPITPARASPQIAFEY